jgi:hypothetical protein
MISNAHQMQYRWIPVAQQCHLLYSTQPPGLPDPVVSDGAAEWHSSALIDVSTHGQYQTGAKILPHFAPCQRNVFRWGSWKVISLELLLCQLWVADTREVIGRLGSWVSLKG